MRLEQRSKIELDVELPARAFVGFPVWAAVTMRNTTADVLFCGVPYCSPLCDTIPLRMSWRSRDGAVHEMPARIPEIEGGMAGSPLGPGEVRRSTVDISPILAQLEPGTWELEAVLTEPVVAKAVPVRIELVLPSPADARVAAALREENDLEEPGWPWFLLANHRTITPDDLVDLEEEGRNALGLWLWLHRATYAPGGIGELSVSDLAGAESPAPESEHALLRHEILCASGAEGADGIGHAILERWPGLAERTEANRRGDGLLSNLRRFYGAECEGSAGAQAPYAS